MMHTCNDCACKEGKLNFGMENWKEDKLMLHACFCMQKGKLNLALENLKEQKLMPHAVLLQEKSDN